MEAITPEVIRKHLKGKATREETELVDAWYQSCENNPALTPSLDIETLLALKAKMWQAIAGQVAGVRPLFVTPWSC